MSQEARIGIIGGSGLYEMEPLTRTRRVTIETPFGPPSDQYLLGSLAGVKVAFLPRHGLGHRLSPSELNFRANIFGFKKLGVERIIAITAVGSLREDIHPLDMVIPDQLFDRTKGRFSTFFGQGLVAHISFADPFCPDLAGLLHESAVESGAKVHQGGTLVCIEGPAFSTRAESELFRGWGMDIIGMTTLQEAKLAREAEICYAALALVTDYDCWHLEEGEVTVGTVVQNLEKNISAAKRIILSTVPRADAEPGCSCGSALNRAIMTDPALIPAQTLEMLKPLVGKYIK
jgi:5'-methylthioadenosine phosphorylase